MAQGPRKKPGIIRAGRDGKTVHGLGFQPGRRPLGEWSPGGGCPLCTNGGAMEQKFARLLLAAWRTDPLLNLGENAAQDIDLVQVQTRPVKQAP